jgi:hypothetical protein
MNAKYNLLLDMNADESIFSDVFEIIEVIREPLAKIAKRLNLLDKSI